MARKTSRNTAKPPRHQAAPAVQGVQGVVAAVYTRDALVWSEGAELLCGLRGRFRREERPVVGDRVVFTPLKDGSGTIVALHPRRNTLTRRIADRGRAGKVTSAQILAANVDQLVIVAALHDPPFRSGLVERFLIAAAIGGLAPLLCINKIDLERGGELEQCTAPYLALQIPVVAASFLRPETLGALGAALAGKTSVLAGHSGVGKTSLLNALAERDMAVGEVGSGQVARGRHTTTTARMIPLRGDGFAIDSPGVREYGLHGVTPPELARHFPDFQGFLGQCGFGDCIHRGEPRCAVSEAVARGEIAEARYRSYLTLLEELE